MNYILRQIVPDDSGLPFEIHISTNEVKVGRREIISLSRFPQISRDHAIFYKSDDGSLFIKDLDSMNGVYVNDNKIGSFLKRLSVGDKIGFGVPVENADLGLVCILCCDPPPEVKQEVDSTNAAAESLGAKANPAKGFTSMNSDPQASGTDGKNRRSLEFRVSDKISNKLYTSQEFNGAAVVGKMHLGSIPVSACFVPLIRCDSENFEWPLDVKSSSFKELLNRHLISRKRDQQIVDFDDASDGKIIDLRGKDIIYQTSNAMEVEKDSKNECFPSRERSPSVSTTAAKKPRLRSEFSDCNSRTGSDEGNRKGSESSRVMSFSEVDEVIFISDDESYLDFNSSQNCVEMKSEEVEESEDEMYKEIFENGNEVTLSEYFPENEEVEESIESVRAFVNSTIEKRTTEFESPTIRKTNPVLLSNECCSSLDSDSDTESSSEKDYLIRVFSDQNVGRNQMSTETYLQNESVEIYSTSSGNKNTKKSTSKILLIDAQPMTYRPHRLIGRDEGFVERKQFIEVVPLEMKKKRGRPRKKSLEDKQIDTNPVEKSLMHTTQPRRSYKRSVKGKGLEESNKPVDVASSQQKRRRGRPRKVPTKEEQMTNLNSSEKTFKIPLKSSDQKCKSLETLANLKTSTNSSNVVRVRDSSNKTSSVKTRPEKFGSRMGFLINELEINPRSRSETVSKSGSGKSLSNNKVQQAINGSEKTKSTAVNSQRANASTCKSGNSSQSSENRIAVSDLRNPRLKSKEAQAKEDQNQHFQQPDTISPLSNITGKEYVEVANSAIFDVSFLGLVKTLIKWNTKWLQEQAALEIPPSAIAGSAANLPLCYNSYESYVASLYPMVMLEIWEHMYTESRTGSKQFYFSVISYMSRDDCIELKCEAVVNEKVCFTPREGIVAVLELKENLQICTPLFCYIFKHKIDSLNLDSLKVSHWKNLPEEWLRNAKHWTFYAYVRKKEASFALDCLMKGKGICYIRSKLRLADSLHFVKDSLLLPDILRPRLSTFSVKMSPPSATREYTSHQMQVIRGIASEITTSLMEPKIILLNGAPGTGKSHVIIGLLETLFYSSKCTSNLKILITSPSNIAIDEIGSRLVELNETSSWRDYSIKFVRVGLEKQVHPKMMPYFIDRKARDLYEVNSQALKRRERELQALRLEIKNLKVGAPSMEKTERLKYLTNQCNFLRKQPTFKEMDYYTDMTYKTDILKESHIILSTLSSCGLSVMLRTFKPNSPLNFSCCIVDESTQCTELEILQPLMFGISKLVLVGDHKQLPASVLSKFASQYGLGRSMLERFHLYLESLGNESPMMILNEQFRMHSSICEYPSKHFYSGELLTHPDTTLRYKEFPVRPYVLLDILERPKANNPQSQVDFIETSVICTICKFLVEVVNSPSSIGIITSCQAQRSLYVKALYPNPQFKDIEINIVDAYQGREKDIIVVSSLRANNHFDGVSFLKCRRQLNVAITRARKCLIVCVHSASLDLYPEWKSLIKDAKQRRLYFAAASSKDLSIVLRNCVKRK